MAYVVLRNWWKYCPGPFAPWPTFAQRERGEKSATPVEMTVLADRHAENEEGTIYRAPTGAGGTQEFVERRIKERLKEGALSQ